MNIEREVDFDRELSYVSSHWTYSVNLTPYEQIVMALKNVSARKVAIATGNLGLGSDGYCE